MTKVIKLAIDGCTIVKKNVLRGVFSCICAKIVVSLQPICKLRKISAYMKEITTKKLMDTIIEGIRNRKGQRIVTIDLRKIKEAPVEMMVICEGQSNTQVSAIADEVDDFVRTTTHIHPLSVAGQENAEWIAMDYGTIFVHIMQREPLRSHELVWPPHKLRPLPSRHHRQNPLHLRAFRECDNRLYMLCRWLPNGRHIT